MKVSADEVKARIAHLQQVALSGHGEASWWSVIGTLIERLAAVQGLGATPTPLDMTRLALQEDRYYLGLVEVGGPEDPAPRRFWYLGQFYQTPYGRGVSRRSGWVMDLGGEPDVELEEFTRLWDMTDVLARLV